MLTQQNQAHKCLLNLKWKFIYCTKESDLIREPNPEIEGAEHLKWSSSRIFWRQKALVIKDQWILKISCLFVPFISYEENKVSWIIPSIRLGKLIETSQFWKHHAWACPITQPLYLQILSYPENWINNFCAKSSGTFWSRGLYLIWPFSIGT
jgi:hypothetical protein